MNYKQHVMIEIAVRDNKNKLKQNCCIF